MLTLILEKPFKKNKEFDGGLYEENNRVSLFIAIFIQKSNFIVTEYFRQKQYRLPIKY